MSAVQTANESHAHLMDRMYRYQRYIYDFTRKYYLFGRDTLIRELNPPPGASVLEVGCGTGRNLAVIGDLYPGARLFGLDISAEMLATAKAKLRRQNRPDAVLRVADATNFTAASFDQEGFDRIVISYALSMVPEWEKRSMPRLPRSSRAARCISPTSASRKVGRPASAASSRPGSDASTSRRAKRFSM